MDPHIQLRNLDDLTERLNAVLIERGFVSGNDALPEMDRKITVGEAAPNIEFTWTSEGLEAQSLEDLRGRIIVLDFWATWCGPCIAAFPNLRALQAEFDPEDVVLVGITSLQGFHMTPDRERIDTEDDPQREYELMVPFMTKQDMTWSVAFSEQNVFNPEYGVQGIPSAFVIDRNGVLRTPRINPYGSGHKQIVHVIRELLAAEADDRTDNAFSHRRCTGR